MESFGVRRLHAYGIDGDAMRRALDFQRGVNTHESQLHDELWWSLIDDPMMPRGLVYFVHPRTQSIQWALRLDRRSHDNHLGAVGTE